MKHKTNFTTSRTYSAKYELIIFVIKKHDEGNKLKGVIIQK